MSNTQVGSVYSRIVEDVINQCRAPFEEEGTQAHVLDDFKKVWQQKISERRVADMPWDPKPPPVAPAPTQQAPQPRAPPAYVPPPQPQQAPANIDVKVKVDTDLANLPSHQPTFTHASDPNLARERAAAQMRNQYGEAAAASIQHLQQPIAEAPHGVKRPLTQSSPTAEQFDSKRLATDYNRGQQHMAQQRIQQLTAAQRHGHPPLGNAQTDGAADWAQMVADRRALVAEGSAAADLSIAERVAALQRMEEGNGVMEPHSKQKRKTRTPTALTAALPSTTGHPGFDGVDEDEDEDVKESFVDDADAINSDLDDDDEADDLVEDDDEKAGEVMVCTYEKVARVKNKWKCTLRDGILSTGGREYIFSKATGEFEW